MGLTGAVKSVLPMLAGALAAKIAAKKFGSGADEDKNGGWDWKDYLIGGLGTIAASLISRTLMRSSPATSQKIMEGGLLILAYKIVTQEIAPMSDTVKGWLGQDEDFAPAGFGQAPEYEIGDLAEGADGETYVLGSDWRWRPADSSNRAISAADDEEDFAPAGYGGDLVRPGQLGVSGFGDSLVSPGQLGAVPAAWIKEADAGF